MLELQSLSAGYGENPVLESLSLAVGGGEILAVIGPNGAGKTTLIRGVSGVIPLSAGRVLVGGQDLNGMSPLARAHLLAVVPQARQLPGAYTVYQAVLLGRTPYLGWLGQAGKSDHAVVRQALVQAGILALAERRVGQLSGGEQQLVLLARALAQSTPVLLLDEPTTHLDLQHQSGLLSLVRALAAEKGLAVVMVLHDLNLASLYASLVALLASGKLQALGSPEEVLTEEHLTATYRVPVHVIPHPQYGKPLILPDGLLPALYSERYTLPASDCRN